MEEPTQDTQERELIAPDEPVSDEDMPMDRPQPDDGNQNDIQDAQIMPLQADDNSDAAMTMMRAESDNTETNDTRPNDMLVIGAVALVIVLLAVLTVMLLKRKSTSTHNDTDHNSQ